MKSKIVIVDGDSAAKLSKMLRGTGAEIYTATNLEDGIELINAQQPDVVSLDNYMKNDEYDRRQRPYGGDIAKACKQVWRSMRVIGISTMPGTFTHTECFDAVLDKKKDINKYRRTVEGLLNASEEH
jgi:CheY-like chemotaxis protein